MQLTPQDTNIVTVISSTLMTQPFRVPKYQPFTERKFEFLYLLTKFCSFETSTNFSMRYQTRQTFAYRAIVQSYGHKTIVSRGVSTAVLSVCTSVCLSVCLVPLLYRNGLTSSYFLQHMVLVAQSF